MYILKIKNVTSIIVTIEDELKGNQTREVTLTDFKILRQLIGTKFDFEARYKDPVFDDAENIIVTGTIAFDPEGTPGEIKITEETKEKITEGKWWYGST